MSFRLRGVRGERGVPIIAAKPGIFSKREIDWQGARGRRNNLNPLGVEDVEKSCQEEVMKFPGSEGGESRRQARDSTLGCRLLEAARTASAGPPKRTTALGRWR